MRDMRPGDVAMWFACGLVGALAFQLLARLLA